LEIEKLEILKKRAIEWRYSSVVSRTFPPSYSHKKRKVHGGIKPPELCLELILAFGSSAQMILDPFAGVGSTLIASSIINRSAVGIEINPNWKEVYQQVCRENNVKEQEWYVGDSKDVLKEFQANTFDFVLTDVPYFSMDKLKKTRGRFSRAGEPTKEKLPSSLKIFNQIPIPSYPSWLKLLKEVYTQVYRILKPSSYVLTFIGNMYRNTIINKRNSKKIGKYYMLSAEVAELLVNIGFQHIHELIWMDTGKKLGIYGYPFVWIPSLVDQRVLIHYKH
jgi:DNA modification methylase